MMSASSTKASPLIKSLARKFDPNALQSQRPTNAEEAMKRSLNINKTISFNSMDAKMDLLSLKIDRLLIIQDTVLQELDKVSQEVGEIENDVKTVKVEKARISLTSETKQKEYMSEMKKLCLEMSSALSEICKHGEHHVKRLDGVEQIVLGIQQLLSCLAKKMKTSKVFDLLFKSQVTPKPGIKNGNLKKAKIKTSFRMRSLPQKKDALVSKENEKVIKEQKAKDKNEKPCLVSKGAKPLKKKKPPDSTVRPVQKNQSSSYKERVLKLNKENAESINTSLAHCNTPKRYARAPNDDEGITSESPTELRPAAVPDATEDIPPVQQSYNGENVHQKIAAQIVEKQQEALGSDKSHEDNEEFNEERKALSRLKKVVIEMGGENGEEKRRVEVEREEETVEEIKSESTIEAVEEVQGDVDLHEGQDQGIDTADTAEDVSRSSSSDGPEKELKPSKNITEEFNKNSIIPPEGCDDSKENGPLPLNPNNEISIELPQSADLNCYECTVSSKRRVTDEDLLKDGNKKSRVETEVAEDVLISKAEEAHLISKDAPEVPDSLEQSQPEPAIDDKQLRILFGISPPPAAPFAHRIVSAKHAQVNNFYTVSETKVLGGGRFGQVHQCVEKSSGLTLAAKIIKARGLKEKEEVKNEIYIMNQLKHVNLLQLYDAFESRNDIVLIMEYVAGGELFDRIISENYNLTELDTILFIKQICEGIQYMHQMYILHLDLKPENIMCVNPAANQIKIIDFGLARRYKPREKLKVNFGTPEFLAPEVINYDFVSFPTDMWSIGVITYMLLSGLSPFLGEDDNETLNNILACNWDFEDEEFHDVSKEAKDFITKLLIKEKCWRISATESLKHPWLSDLKLRCRLSHQRKTKCSSVSRTPITQ